MAKRSGGGDSTMAVVAVVVIFLFLKYGSSGDFGKPGPVSLPKLPSPTAKTATKTAPKVTAKPAPKAVPGPGAKDTVPIRLSVGQARAELASLPRQARTTHDASYQRPYFGPSWKDVDRNGCNTRDDVLLRDLTKARPHKLARQGRCDHDVLAGTFPDAYSSTVMTFTNLKDRKQSSAIQIDHTVALSEAWRYGAKTWSADKRLRFANWQPHLVSSVGKTNMSKGDRDPAEWRPTKPYQCRYAKTYVHTKKVWGLTTDAAQARELGRMLDTCSA